MKFNILLVLTFILLISCNKEPNNSYSLLNYVPDNASLIIKTNNLDSLKYQINANGFISNIKSSKAYTKIAHKLTPLKYVTNNTKGILSFTELETGEHEFTYTIEQKDSLFTNTQTRDSIHTITYKNHTIEKHIYKDATFFTLNINNTSILSSSEAVLQNVLAKINNVEIDPVLKRLQNVPNKNKSAIVIANLNKVNSIVSTVLKEDSSFNASDYADWLSADISLDSKSLHISGISLINDSLPKYLNLFKNTNALKNTIASFAPINASAIQSYTFDDYSEFSKNQQLFLENSTSIDSLFNTVEEIGYIHLKGEKAIVLNTYGSENIYDFLNANKKETIDYQGNEILELKTSKLLNLFFNPIINNYKASYCTILENSFVFSSNKNTLQTIIKNYKNNATYLNNSTYTSIYNTLAEESTTLYISNAENIKNTIAEHCSSSFYKDFKNLKISNYAFGLQTVADKNFYHTNFTITPIIKEKKNSSVTPAFSLQLENEIAKNPQFVTNHTTKKKEILVQDINNILYLISNTGQILWEKQLHSAIQGKIHQVDLYKNGRLQLAFTTSNQFLILDRNGKEVAPFTMNFKDGNLNPLAVFDYENKKEYRFIVTQGKQIFMYNSKGKIVKGFKYTKASNTIIDAPKHFIIKNKDYLVFKLEGGKLKIVNRVGKDRVSVKSKIDFSDNEVYVYKDKFNSTDVDGTLHQIDVNGKDTKTKLELVKDHGLVTTSRSLVYMNDNTLSIKGKKVTLDLGVYDKPQIFLVNNKMYISITDIQNQNIYLFDSQAKLQPGFPIFGTSTIDLNDMDGDKKPDIVTKDQDNSIVVYKMQ